MRTLIFGWLLIVLLAACESNREVSTLQGNPRPLLDRTLQIVTGQTLYVPAYSEVFYGTRDRTYPLGITLTIHNTDQEHTIIIQTVRYYDTDGVLIRDYVEQPVEVGPLATIGFIVPDDDKRGGFGANFIVEWVGEQPVSEPIVEAVMVSARDTQGISIVSPGRILSQISADAEAATD